MLHFIEKCIFLLVFCLAAPALSAQKRIAGQVINQQDGAPVAGAHVAYPGSGTFTDEQGYFSIPSGTLQIEVSALGFATLQYTVKPEAAFLVLRMEPAGLALEGIVVEAPRLTFPLHTAASVQVLGQRELLRDNELSIAPALNRVPGVYMQSGTLSTNRITIRGIGNRSLFGTSRIRAYMGDIPLTNGVGETALEDWDLSLLQSVEVWKGPSASHLGAGLGGVIVLNPFAPQSALPASHLELQTQWAAFGVSRQVLRSFLAGADRKTQLHLNYNRLQGEGYRENNATRRQSFNALGAVEAGAHTFTALVHYTDARAEIPSSINRTDFTANPRKAAANWAAIKGFEDYQQMTAGLSHHYTLWSNAAGKSLRSRVSWFTNVRNNYESRPFNILRESNQSQGVRAVLEYRDRAGSPDPAFLAGGEYFRERYAWTTNATRQGTLDTLLSDQQELRKYANFFAEYRRSWNARWFFTAGLNLNTTVYTLTDYYFRDSDDKSGERHFPPVLSPRLTWSYRFHPQAALFATLSHGFAAPTLEETLAPAGNINPEIRPEKGWNMEIGSRGNYLGGRLSYEISLYAMQVRDLLVSRRTAEDAYVGINAGKTLHLGMESAGRYRLLAGKWNADLALSYTFSGHRFLEFVDDGRDYSGNALTGTPPHQFTAVFDLQMPAGFFALLNYEFVDAFPMRDDNAVFSDAYQLLNLKLGYTLSADKWRIEASAGIQNLANARYAGMIQVNAAAFGTQLPRYYYPGLPRHGFAGIRLRRDL